MKIAEAFGRTDTLLSKLLTLRVILVLLALIASALALIRTALHGIALHGDSVIYIAVARNLAAGNGYRYFDDSHLTGWAPLYPTILALLDFLFGVDPLTGATFFDAAIFGLIVFSSGLLFQRYIATPSVVAIGAAAVLLSPDLLRLSTYGLSDPLFIFCTIIFLLGLNTYLKNGTTASLCLVAVVAGMVCLTRYIGVTVILAGGATILFNKRCAARKRILHFLLFGVIACMPLAAWAFRNVLLTGEPFLSRGPSKNPLYYNLYYALLFHLNWVFPIYFIGVTIKSRGALALLAAISGYLAGAFLKPKEVWSWSKRAASRLNAVSMFYVVYVAFLVVFSSVVGIERIGYRYISPAFIPAVLIILFIIEQQLLASNESFSLNLFGHASRFPKMTLVVFLLVGFFSISFVRVAATIAQPVEAENNLNHASWRNSETIHYVKDLWLRQGDEIPIYSIVADAIYMHANVPANPLPEAKRHNSSEPRKPAQSLLGIWPQSPKAYLVWFDSIEESHRFSVEELKQIADFKTVAALADGTIYEVTAK